MWKCKNDGLSLTKKKKNSFLAINLWWYNYKKRNTSNQKVTRQYEKITYPKLSSSQKLGLQDSHLNFASQDKSSKNS